MAAEVYLEVKVGNENVLALVDSGNARGNLMSQRLASKLGLSIEQTQLKAAGVSGKDIAIAGIVRNVSFIIDENWVFQEDFFVIVDMVVPLNFGSSWMKRHENHG